MLASERLGFPADARVLIINADDFGMYPAINAAVLESIERGVASSCSLMPPCPGAAEALRLLMARPNLPFGIHLTLVSESARMRFRPMAGPERVPSLVDRDGFLILAEDRESLLRIAILGEVEVELRAQIDSVLRTGLSPTHLDWHSLADGGRSDIFELGLDLAAQYGLAARVWLEPGRQLARGRGLPVVDHPFVDSFSLGVEGKAERFAALVEALPAGLSEWAVHPGPAGADAEPADDGRWVRASDLAWLASAAAAQQLRDAGITVIDYRGLQEAWRG
ncbi:ChbG/HpnK family deacetylase [Angustibacter luteus]|uniref:ChbG/HpnK family deacetylase n=1 Tax=Angustibacter luteus TaxID=658456 RepID=A0ABW1JBW4_9ACTN